jgi:PAS domain S-box-containing protein
MTNKEFVAPEASKGSEGVLIDKIADGIVVVDQEGLVCFLNPAAANLLDRDPSEILGQPIGLPIVGADFAAVNLVRTDGKPCFVELRTVETEWNGQSASVVSLRDVTSRHEAIQKLSRERERLNLALKAGNMGLFEMNCESDELWWSPTTYVLFGVKPESFEPTFESLISLVHPQDQELLKQHFEENIALEQPIHHEFRIQGPDGKERWINCHGQIEFKDTGQPWRYFGIFIDVSMRRQSEQMLRKWEKLAAAARMSATMAHEINNPLNGAVNLLFLAKATPGIPSGVAVLLGQAEQELERVALTARQVLGFYRESGGTEQVDLPALADSVLKLFSNKLTLKKIRIARAFEACPPVQAVRGELQQVISNLLSNAIDAVPVNGVITIGAHGIPDGGNTRVEIFIADNGPGIPVEAMERIFEPFYTTKTETGTGLGLWIVKEIVERHGGSISVHPHLDNGEKLCGALFTIKLSCKPAAARPQA